MRKDSLVSIIFCILIAFVFIQPISALPDSLGIGTLDGYYLRLGDVSLANVNHSNSTSYWDGETSQADLNVNDSDYLDGYDSTDFILGSSEGDLNVNHSDTSGTATTWDGETSQANLNVNYSDNSGALEGTDLGTLTDAKWCVYDLAGTEIDCNVEPVTDTTYTAGNKLYLTGTQFNVNDTEINQSIEAYGYSTTTGITYIKTGDDVQAAINLCGSSCHVVMSPGLYTVTRNVTYQDNLLIEAYGVTIKLNDSISQPVFVNQNNTDNVGNTNVTIRGLIIDGNGAAQSSISDFGTAGFTCKGNCSNIRLIDVTVRNTADSGIIIGHDDTDNAGYYADIKIQDCILDNIGVQSGNTNKGIQIRNADVSEISGCVMNDGREQAIHYLESYYANVHDNYIDSFAGGGIWFSYGTSYSRAINNEIRNTTSDNIALSAALGTRDTMPPFKNTASLNKIYDALNSGITCGYSHCYVSNNEIDKAAVYGIYVLALEDITDVKIVDNKMINRGIIINGDNQNSSVSDVRVVGNTIVNNSDRGIDLKGNQYMTFKGVTVKYNSVQGEFTGIRIGGNGTDIDLSSNNLRDMKAGQVGLELDGTQSYNLLGLNTFQNVSGTQMYLNGVKSYYNATYYSPIYVNNDMHVGDDLHVTNNLYAQNGSFDQVSATDINVDGVISSENISLGKFLHHTADGDTWIYFDLDRIIFRAGNVEMLDIRETAGDDVVNVNADLNVFNMVYVNTTNGIINIRNETSIQALTVNDNPAACNLINTFMTETDMNVSTCTGINGSLINANHSDTSGTATTWDGETSQANLNVNYSDNSGALEGTDLGTLTDAKWCVYDLAGTEIDCNVEPVTDTTYTAGNKLYLTGTQFNVNDTEINQSIEAYGYSTTTGTVTSVATDDTYLTGGAITTTGTITFNETLAGTNLAVNSSDHWDGYDSPADFSWSGDLSGTGLSPEVVDDSHLHAAENITSGTFGAGDYTFPGNLIVSDDLTTDNITMNGIYLSLENGSKTIGHHKKDGVVDSVFDFSVETVPSWLISDDFNLSQIGDLEINWTEGHVWDEHETQDVVSFSANSSYAVTDNQTTYFYVDVTSPGALSISTSHPEHPNIPIAHVHAQNGKIWSLHVHEELSHQTNNIYSGLDEVFPITVTEGMVVSEDTNVTYAFDVSMTAGTYYVAMHNRYEPEIYYSRISNLTRWSHSGSGWSYDTSQVINASYWDNGTGLEPRTANKYYKSVFFWIGDSLHWVYPTVEYDTIAQAIIADIPSLPNTFIPHAATLMAVVLKGDATAFPTAGGTQWIDVRPIVGTVSSSGSIADHGNLAGLGDDDHTQYLLAAGTRALTSEWDADRNITAPNFIGNVTGYIEDDFVLVSHANCSSGYAIIGFETNLSVWYCTDAWLNAAGDTWAGNQDANSNNLTDAAYMSISSAGNEHVLDIDINNNISAGSDYANFNSAININTTQNPNALLFGYTSLMRIQSYGDGGAVSSSLLRLDAQDPAADEDLLSLYHRGVGDAIYIVMDGGGESTSGSAFDIFNNKNNSDHLLKVSNAYDYSTGDILNIHTDGYGSAIELDCDEGGSRYGCLFIDSDGTRPAINVTDGMSYFVDNVTLGDSLIVTTTITDGTLSIEGGNISSAGMITATTLTDGTLSSTAGSITNAVDITGTGDLSMRNITASDDIIVAESNRYCGDGATCAHAMSYNGSGWVWT